MMGQDYRDLLAWQKAMTLAEFIYEASKEFPTDERFGLVSQMRRAAVSIASNIAEGQGRYSAGEFRQFLSNANGSVREVETQVELASRLQYLDKNKAAALQNSIREVGALITGLSTSNLRNHGDFVRRTNRLDTEY